MIQQDQIQKKRGNPNWTKGQSANPSGRPLGSRNKIAENVLTAFSLTSGEDAETSLRELRANDPGRFWTIAASLLPRETLLSVKQVTPGNLSADEFNRLVWLLSIPESLGAKGTPDEIAERIERALRAEFATTVAMIEHQPALPAPPYRNTDCVSVSPENSA